jgi:alkylation response protein AidB-like acyl-CoA dehydrogenase
MEYFLTEKQQELQKLVRNLAVEKIKPIRAKHDRDSTFPWEIIDDFKKAGLFKIYVPEEYGGTGGDVMDLVIVIEELSRICGGIALIMAATALGTFPILLNGSDYHKERYLPDLNEGNMLAGFCLTEPTAGSDAGSIKTRAVRKGDKYILNGTKHFITNGSIAKIYTVIASTDPSRGTRGATAFIVEEGFPGLRYGKIEDKMGIRASVTSEVIFEDCEVPVENRIGKEGEGFKVAMRTLDRSRPGVAAQALGIAQGALDLAAEYASQREQFGKTISTFQGIQFMLADMATQVEGSRALIYQVARMIDSGMTKIAKDASICKLYASDVAMRVTTDAVQIFGGYGYMKDYPIEKFMRDAKITQIYEGTNQIQRTVIARHLLKETASRQGA